MAWNSYLLYRFKVQFSSGYRYWAVFSDYPAYFGGSDAIYTKDGKTYYNSGVNAFDNGAWLKCNAHIFATNPNQTFYIARSDTNTENYTVRYTAGGMTQTGQYYVLSGDMYNQGYIEWSFEQSYSGQYQITEIYSEYPDSCFSSNQAGFIAYITTGLQPPYNWQSVSSISGKNGILSLVTLDSESINDGEPVSGAAVSVFDQNPVSGNNVKDIVDGNTPLIPSAVDVTATFIISNPPVGELASRILAAKKDSIPESIEDADKIVSIPANASNVTMPDLDENSQYYFAIFVADATGDTAVSDPKDIYTSGDEGWSFDYTGQIQTFTAPKTGIYSLETWGAQGGDATDGTNSARGGYGAYAVGEVFLTQGDTLYINVGGQNGYGGGGNYQPPQESIDENKCKSVDFANAYAVDVDYSGWVLDKISVFASFDYLTTGYPLNCYNDGNTRDTITYNNGEVVFNGSNYNLSSIAYALNQTYNNVVAIMFDLSISGVVGGYACGNVDLISISNQKEIVDSNRVSIAYSGTQRDDYDFIAQDGSYHTYTKEFNSPISGVNYIAFDKNGANIAIKNVILILQ